MKVNHELNTKERFRLVNIAYKTWNGKMDFHTHLGLLYDFCLNSVYFTSVRKSEENKEENETERETNGRET